jgi:uncharacterized protein (UPF0264 family)
VDPVVDDVGATLAESAVAALALATVDFVDVAVYADQEDVKAVQQVSQLASPRRELDDVFDDQVIAGVSERRQASVEPGKEPGA